MVLLVWGGKGSSGFSGDNRIAPMDVGTTGDRSRYMYYRGEGHKAGPGHLHSIMDSGCTVLGAWPVLWLLRKVQ